ncbi:uncharacterized protein LOC119601810 [Lucilia sericata]|uniref:uncharacterized protein LOC119601810 n=1 Tax=Lucilia sericata TaxID=13632 RepID=UPI0018A842FF|nr:uncharacterized protein LOC119601810 [Lucilia sericata]
MLLVYAADSLESAASKKVSTPIPTCNEKDVNLNDCLLKVFADMIPRSKDGIPEINVPPMDPFVINRTSYIFSHPIVQGKVAVRNLKIHGLSKVITKSLDFKREGSQVNFKVKSFIPEMFAEGMYKAKIKLNAANISSKGPFNVTLTNIDVDIETTSELYERDGHRYMRLKTFNFDPIVGNMKFYAEGLLPEPLLNEAILEFINQNWRTIYKSLVPETRAAWEPEFVKLSNEYFSHVMVDAVLKGD